MTVKRYLVLDLLILTTGWWIRLLVVAIRPHHHDFALGVGIGFCAMVMALCLDYLLSKGKR